MITFVMGIVALIVVLYVPGMLVFRAVGFTRLHALVAAPLYGAMVVGVLPLAYYNLGISCTLPSILGPMLLFSLALYVISRGWRSDGRPTFDLHGTDSGSGARDTADDWKLALLYVACGIIACTLIFGCNLSSPDAAYIRYDNQTHLNVTKAFLDSGSWSSLHPNRYLDLAVASRPVVSGPASFYPSLLYALSALDGLMTGLSAAAAYNVVLFTLCAVVFPLGMFAIMRVMFGDNRLVVALGAIASVAFAAFPWGVFVRGLFPNIASYCLMAPAIGSTIALLSKNMKLGVIARGILLWVIAMPALAIAHPNGVFTAFIFIVAYAAHVAGQRRASSAEAAGKSPLRARMVAVAIIVAAALVLWVVCLNLPALSSTVHYFGNTILSPLNVGARVLFLRFDPFPYQFVLALVVVVGVVMCFRKRSLWLLAPVLWMALAYFIIRTQNSPLAHFLAGFWYCDHVRIGAALCIFEMPLAALGLATIVKGVMALVARITHDDSETPQRVFGGLAFLVICACIFMPNIYLPGRSEPLLETSFGSVYSNMHDMYCETNDSVYGSDEIAFVNEAAEITKDELVLNYPGDGSTFSYPVNGMKTYFRSTKTNKQTDAATTIRSKLCDYATDKNVHDAVASTGARYLLKLDHGVSFEDGTWFRQYQNPSRYAGIENVGDDTPGFSVVLSRGDMRLYRIE